MKSKLKALAQELGITTLAFSIALVLLLGVTVVKAWTAPGSNPPAGNLGAPLNTSANGQTKQGGLILNTSGAANGLIVQNGNVGIGTASPDVKLRIHYGADQNLRIGNSGNAAYLLSTNDAWNTYNPLQLNGIPIALNPDGGGSVGIGTNNPQAKLHVVGGRTFLDANNEPYSLYLQYNSGTPGMFLGGDAAGNLQISSNGGADVFDMTPAGKATFGSTPSNMNAKVSISAPQPVGAGQWPLYLASTSMLSSVFLGTDGADGLAVANGSTGNQVMHIQGDGTILTGGAVFAFGVMTAQGHNYYNVPIAGTGNGWDLNNLSGGNCNTPNINTGAGWVWQACTQACTTWCRGGYTGIPYSGGVIQYWDAADNIASCTCLP